MDEENKGYRCMKCEGKNVKDHGRFCPSRKRKKATTNI